MTTTKLTAAQKRDLRAIADGLYVHQIRGGTVGKLRDMGLLEYVRVGEPICGSYRNDTVLSPAGRALLAQMESR
jgi:hypothetical protein